MCKKYMVAENLTGSNDSFFFFSFEALIKINKNYSSKTELSLHFYLKLVNAKA